MVLGKEDWLVNGYPAAMQNVTGCLLFKDVSLQLFCIKRHSYKTENPLI